MSIAMVADLETREKVLCMHGARSQSCWQPVSRHLRTNRSLTSARSACVGRGRVAHVNKLEGVPDDDDVGPWKQGVYPVLCYFVRQGRICRFQTASFR